MPEISLASGTEEAASSGSGGGFDITGLMDELEQAQDRLMENPQLAQMLGIDLSEFTDDMEQAQEQGEETGVPLNSETLLAILRGVEKQGFGDMSVSDVKTWVENNPEQVDNLIEQHG